VHNRKSLSLKLTADQVNATAEFLGLGIKVTADELEVHDEYLGEKYGIPTKESLAAIRTVAQTEGFFIDPVYTSKAMSGLIDLSKKGRFKPSDTVVFIHTGGVPALFAYQPEIVK
jgi:1-aminocyclopropane-1-carboxylate deaminase/D-cysteine desulfhydrase-like pyridoxal-dependent ACC family enzyme